MESIFNSLFVLFPLPAVNRLYLEKCHQASGCDQHLHIVIIQMTADLGSISTQRCHTQTYGNFRTTGKPNALHPKRFECVLLNDSDFIS